MLTCGKRTFKWLVLCWFLFVFSGSPGYLQGESEVHKDVWRNDTVFQYSTLTALFGGLLDGELTVGELLKKGNTGLGTFNALDGEMIVLDGKVYKVKASGGNAYLMPESEKIPFAVVTDFKSDFSTKLGKPLDYKELQDYLDTLLPSENLFYALRIEGAFSYVKARSVPPQEKPYPPLKEIAKMETRFEFKDVEGVLVGFRFPAFMEDLNVPRYHLHFLTGDRKKGGHLLDCRVAQVVVQLDYISGFDLSLPKSKEFFKMSVAQEAHD